ncbi:MAG TPA: hypothetical protein VM493_00215 [Vicinamibacterales bacterium]|nr:hypothetical protein [Vicinamibacterales bacterium]
MIFRFDDRELRLFSTITTFGTPMDVTWDEVAIESAFHNLGPRIGERRAVGREARRRGISGYFEEAQRCGRWRAAAEPTGEVVKCALVLLPGRRPDC